MEFLLKVDKDFTPCLSQKTDLYTFCERLLTYANLFVSKTQTGDINGLVALYANDFVKKYAYIPLVAVAPEDRKRGIARKLMNDAIDYAKGIGAENIQTIGIHTSNPVAFDFYKELGFQLLDESYNREYMELYL